MRPTEQPSLQHPLELTWDYLIDRFFVALEAAGKGNQEANFKTAFKHFLISIDLAKESPVGRELGDEFESKIELFIKFEVGRKLSPSTYKPRVSKIRDLKSFAEANFEENLRLQTLPQTFGQQLRKLISSSGHTIKSFWETLPAGLVGYSTLLHWCIERSYPRVRHEAIIKMLESCLRLPEGTLRLSRYRYVGQQKVRYGNAADKSRAALSKPYYVWTDSLEEEYQKLFTHKTEAILPDGEQRHIRGQWTSSEGAGVPSADIVRLFLRSFMGFCALSEYSPDPYLRGQGIKLDELSLALLADKELVEAYLKFKRLRSGLRARPVEKSNVMTSAADSISANGRWEFYDKGGKYNQGSIQALVYISGLLRSGTGYLYQHPEFAKKLGSRMTAASWHKQCVVTRARVDKILREIRTMRANNDQDNYDFGRDPKERIVWILDLKRPLLFLQEMLKELSSDLMPEGASAAERARQYRDMLLFALLCANPLRIRMFSIMEFDKHLIRLDDGSWRLRFKRGAFKNRRSLKSDYEVRVAQELWPMLDHYRKEFHPILAGSTASRHVFIRTARGGGGREQGTPLSSDSLSYIINHLTEQYTPDGVGFGPHAFRHIVATDIIKKDPRIGFFLAARALHDKLETVEREYIHLKTSEFFEPVNTHFSEAWNQVFSLSPAGSGLQPL